MTDELKPVAQLVLEDRLDALKKKPETPRRKRRIAEAEEAVAAYLAKAEQARSRAAGLLAPLRGSSAAGGVARGVVYSRRGEGQPYAVYRVVPKFTPSTATPMTSEKRRARKAWERALGRRIGGREWVRLRKMLKRSQKALQAQLDA